MLQQFNCTARVQNLHTALTWLTLKDCKKYSHWLKWAMHICSLWSCFFSHLLNICHIGKGVYIRKNLPFTERSSIPVEKYFKEHKSKLSFLYKQEKQFGLKTKLFFSFCFLTASAFHFSCTLLPCFTWGKASQLTKHWKTNDKFFLPLYTLWDGRGKEKYYNYFLMLISSTSICCTQLPLV